MMRTVISLIPELEDVLQTGSSKKRAATLRKITDFFLKGVNSFNEEHVGLFDDVLGALIEEIEVKARAELSRRLAPVGNAPTEVVRRLAKDDDITVAGPMILRSPRLGEADLVDIAKTKGQEHLLALSARRNIGEVVTDLLVERGNREVARSVAVNRGARLSETGFSMLVKQAEQDSVLAERIGLRPDVPAHLFRELVMKATDVVRRRLLAGARPETREEIRRVLEAIAQELNAGAKPRDYHSAQRLVLALNQEGKLNEAVLTGFAKAGQFEETVAALSALCAVPIETVDRLMCGERPDPVLILCKAAGFDWSSTCAVMEMRQGDKGLSQQVLDDSRANFERLSRSTAQRVVRFWQARPPEARRAG
jgi:uncharacterized protein (DUF2336 family)